MAMSTEAFASGVTPKMAAHYAQLKKQKEMQGLSEQMDTVQLQKRNSPVSEENICGRFGVRELRPFQRDVLQQLGVLGSTDAAGPDTRSDVLCVQPTGAGKSVCFQAAAAILEGCTLIVSPLLSLMFDQVESMTESGIRAATLNSMQSAAEREAVMRSLAAGELDLLYTSPEQLDKNQKLIATLAKLSVPLLAIDEAHCISSWGHDFRPSYRRIASLRDVLGIPRLVALTASAPPHVRDDIALQLNMGEAHVRLVASCRRYVRISKQSSKQSSK
jgi:RecQ family ATP-dependent DNA helicase